MSIRSRATAVVLAVVLLLLPASGAFAAETTAEVTRLTATASATALSVSGQATYASDQGVVVVDDPVGDSTAPAAVPATEIDTASITASTPQDLEFAITLADAGDGPVPLVSYLWEFEVADSFRYYLLGAGNTQNLDTAGEMHFYLRDCSIFGGPCTVSVVDGEYADGVLSWSVPTSLIGAAGGSQIISEGEDSGIFTTRHVPSLGSHRQDPFDSALPAPYVVPTATVQLGVAPAGTAVDDVVLDTVVTADADGGFNATLPLAGGDGGVVAARACFGATCGARASAVY